MSADDDGFCNQLSVSMFKAHASVQDLQALLEKRYIYQFENGVIVRTDTDSGEGGEASGG